MDKKLAWRIIYLILLIYSTVALKNLKIIIPSIAKSGDSVTLSCTYDLENSLYTIKWYFKDEEFYRYVPEAIPPKISYSVQGIKIKMENSNENDVTLLNISRNLTGLYKCEVSEDSPLYHTDIKEERMQVIDVPEVEPVITVEKNKIVAGEALKANCTSGASNPPTNITWVLNSTPLQTKFFSSEMKIQNGTSPSSTGDKDHEISWSTLELNTTNRFFQNGRILLKCFATIFEVYSSTAESEITDDAPRLASITGDASPHRGKNGCGRMESQSIRILSIITGAVKLFFYLR